MSWSWRSLMVRIATYLTVEEGPLRNFIRLIPYHLQFRHIFSHRSLYADFQKSFTFRHYNNQFPFWWVFEYFFLLNYKNFVLSQQIVRDELKIAAIGLESQKCVTKMPMFRLDKTFFFRLKTLFVFLRVSTGQSATTLRFCEFCYVASFFRFFFDGLMRLTSF